MTENVIAAEAKSLALTVNGERTRYAAPLSIVALLDALGLDCRKIAVERNQAIVPRSRHVTTMLEDGDQLEIVHFIGGG